MDENSYLMKSSPKYVPYCLKSERRRMRMCASCHTNGWHTAVLTDAICAHIVWTDFCQMLWLVHALNGFIGNKGIEFV